MKRKLIIFCTIICTSLIPFSVYAKNADNADNDWIYMVLFLIIIFGLIIIAIIDNKKNINNKNNKSNISNVKDNYITNSSTIQTIDTYNNNKIIKLIIDWIDLLYNEEYEKAFNMFQAFNVERKWTPELIKNSIYSYGMPWMTMEEIIDDYGKVNKISNLTEFKKLKEQNISIEKENITEEMAKKRMILDADFENIVGFVMVNNIPLNGSESDLTATFYVKKVTNNAYTLCFLDLHVM